MLVTLRWEESGVKNEQIPVFKKKKSQFDSFYNYLYAHTLDHKKDTCGGEWERRREEKKNE